MDYKIQNRIASYGTYQSDNTKYFIVWTNSAEVAYEAIRHEEFKSPDNVAYIDIEATLYNHKKPHVVSCIQILCGNTIIIMYGPNAKHSLWLLVETMMTKVG
jgi:hypothetical protein